MNYTLLRNAAAILEYAGQRFLIDPSLDPAGARPAIPNTANQRPNPLVELPSGWQKLVEGVDAALVTHLHQDHFDETAARVVNKDLPLLSQPEDVDRLEAHGFEAVTPVDSSLEWQGMSIRRTPAQHGSGEIARAMAPVSGFVLQSANEPTVYIAGDTIWYDDVAATIEAEQPEVIVLNASGASFLEGGPIVMNADDIVRVREAAPHAAIVVVHLDAINHCHETRAFYRQRLPELGVDMAKIIIPEDGETVSVRAGA